MDIIDRIMNSECKYFILALIIIVVVFCAGVFCINITMDSIDQKNINYTDFIVADKYINEDTNYYMIVSDKGSIYEIDGDKKGVKLFNNLKVGSHYFFIIQPPQDAADEYLHIIQVYNDTN